MKHFTEKTKLYALTHCKQFASFKKYIAAPRSIRAIMQVYSLKGLRKFYPFNASEAADTFEYMRDMVDRGKLSYTGFAKKDVGVYSFVIGGGKPFVLILPGGGYGDVCSIIEGYSTARRFNELGFNAFIGNYGVGKQAVAPGPCDDVAAILKWICENAERLDVDTCAYAVCGFSAGGHLAATWGLKELGYAHYGLHKPECEILCYPVITMGEKAHAGSRNKLLGKNKDSETLRLKYSVERQADGEYPKTFLWQCENDLLKDSELLRDRLEQVGVKHVYRVYEGGAHGVGTGKDTAAEEWIEAAVHFWQENRT